MKYVLFVASLFLSSPVFASGACKTLPAADDFVCNTYAAFQFCKLEVEIGLLKGSSPSETFSCIDEEKMAIKPIYKTAKKALDGNEDATEALKDLYSYWLSSMDALIPDMNEKKLEYKYRLSAREDGINDRRNRLKIEVE